MSPYPVSDLPDPVYREVCRKLGYYWLGVGDQFRVCGTDLDARAGGPSRRLKLAYMMRFEIRQRRALGVSKIRNVSTQGAVASVAS